MAGGKLLVLLDDIATLLDDVAVLTKVAAKKTAGVLGDDLALNANQLTGVNVDRELPVVWAVAKGSLINKAILVPAALVINHYAAWLMALLLIVGGLYLCFEGVEKVLHHVLHSKKEDDAHHQELLDAVNNDNIDIVAFEKEKIKGAIRTDFILSAEIIVIAMASMKSVGLTQQVAALIAVAIVMTVGVYGIVALIVKMDDAGLYLLKQQGNIIKQKVGQGLLLAAPLLLKALSILGTLAMFLVGGGIVAHNVPALHHAVEHTKEILLQATSANILHMMVNISFGAISSFVVGFIGGLMVLLFINIMQFAKKGMRST